LLAKVHLRENNIFVGVPDRLEWTDSGHQATRFRLSRNSVALQYVQSPLGFFSNFEASVALPAVRQIDLLTSELVRIHPYRRVQGAATVASPSVLLASEPGEIINA
jgi:hypothetical protein